MAVTVATIGVIVVAALLTGLIAADMRLSRIATNLLNSNHTDVLEAAGQLSDLFMSSSRQSGVWKRVDLCLYDESLHVNLPIHTNATLLLDGSQIVGLLYFGSDKCSKAANTSEEDRLLVIDVSARKSYCTNISSLSTIAELATCTDLGAGEDNYTCSSQAYEAQSPTTQVAVHTSTYGTYMGTIESSPTTTTTMTQYVPNWTSVVPDDRLVTSARVSSTSCVPEPTPEPTTQELYTTSSPRSTILYMTNDRPIPTNYLTPDNFDDNVTQSGDSAEPPPP